MCRARAELVMFLCNLRKRQTPRRRHDHCGKFLIYSHKWRVTLDCWIDGIDGSHGDKEKGPSKGRTISEKMIELAWWTCNKEFVERASSKWEVKKQARASSEDIGNLQEETSFTSTPQGVGMSWQVSLGCPCFGLGFQEGGNELPDFHSFTWETSNSLDSTKYNS